MVPFRVNVIDNRGFLCFGCIEYSRFFRNWRRSSSSVSDIGDVFMALYHPILQCQNREQPERKKKSQSTFHIYEKNVVHEHKMYIYRKQGDKEK